MVVLQSGLQSRSTTTNKHPAVANCVLYESNQITTSSKKETIVESKYRVLFPSPITPVLTFINATRDGASFPRDDRRRTRLGEWRERSQGSGLIRINRNDAEKTPISSRRAHASRRVRGQESSGVPSRPDTYHRRDGARPRPSGTSFTERARKRERGEPGGAILFTLLNQPQRIHFNVFAVHSVNYTA